MHPHILTQRSLTVYAEGAPLAIHSDDERWPRALALLCQGDEVAANDLVELMKPARVIQRALDAGLSAPTGITLTDGRLYMNGEALDGDNDYTVKQILDFDSTGLPTGALVSFYTRLLHNPSFRVRRDLLKFLEVGELPITEDGYFMAYKRVNSDFTDCHTGTLNYTPGTTVSMPRHEVDDDPNNTCSTGLHVCSYGYLRNFSGAKVISVKVDPANVVSIPTDYDNTKMRVCSLTSVEEIPEPKVQNVWRSPLAPGYADGNGYIEDNNPEEGDNHEPLNFRVGDRVKVANSAYDSPGTVVEIDNDDPYPYFVYVENIGKNEWVPADDVKAYV